MNARKILLPLISLVLLTACGGKSNSADPILTSAPTPTDTAQRIIENPAPTPTSSEIEVDTATQLQQILKNTEAQVAKTGVTETWLDSEGQKSLIVAWDPKKNQSVQYDIASDSADTGGLEFTTATIALGDLQDIQAGRMTDGIVSTDKDGNIFMRYTLDESTYITTYTVKNNLLASSKSYADGDLLGSTTFVYAVTGDAKDAFKKAAGN